MADEIKMNDQDLSNVSGGANVQNDGSWQQYAKGKYVKKGDHIVYTVASGDVLSGIAIRFGVTVDEIVKWNNIKDPNFIMAGQLLTIYARILR
jgi:LysM repeat protein